MSEIAFEPPQPPTPPPVPPLPWERPGAGIGDLVSTTTMLLGRPGEAFSRLRATSGVGRSLVYGLVVYVLFNAVGQLWGLALSSALQGLMESFGGGVFAEMQKTGLSPGLQFLLSLLLAPVVFVVGVFVASGVVHLLLLLFGGAPGGFETTLRVNAYSAAPSVVLVFPFLGWLISTIWWVVLLILGLATAHRVPGGRAAAAVLVPFLLCCACTAVAIALATAGAMAALGGMAK
jgi:hypothetical protein